MKLLKATLFSLAVFSAVNISAQTVDEIIQKHIEAKGGAEKISNLKSVKLTGSMNTQGIDVGVVSSTLHDVGVRVDLDIMGSANYQLVNKKGAYTFMPVMGATEQQQLDDESYKGMVSQLDVQGGLFNYAMKGNKVELVGSEKVGRDDAYRLKVTYPNGYVVDYFIDAKSYRLLRTTTLSKENTVAETFYNDYKDNGQGYIFAHSISTPQGTIVVEKVETNVEMPLTLFQE